MPRYLGHDDDRLEQYNRMCYLLFDHLGNARTHALWDAAQLLDPNVAAWEFVDALYAETFPGKERP